MKPVFADTSYYQALISDRDECHDDALLLAATVQSPICTTEWVLAELLNSSSRGKYVRRAAIALVADIYSTPGVSIIPASSQDFPRGFDFFRQRPDKAWSLVDCISFQFMWDRGITHALAFDDHFWQAGFVPFR